MLPIELWSKKPKIIYVTRNVKDAAISRFHMYKGLKYFTGTKEEFLDALMEDKLAYTPYWEHVLEFWAMRNLPNIYFISYERLKADLKQSLRSLCTFLGKSASDDILDKAVNHLSFKNMKKSISGQQMQFTSETGDYVFEFVRRGISGAYKDEFPDGYSDKFDDWIDRCLKGSNVTMEDIICFKKD